MGGAARRRRGDRTGPGGRTDADDWTGPDVMGDPTMGPTAARTSPDDRTDAVVTGEP